LGDLKMKKIITIILLTALVGFTAFGQDVTGKWYGLRGRLRIVFNITKTDSGFSSTVISLDQKAKAIPVTTTTFESSKLILEIPDLTIKYVGELKGNSIIGTFKQDGNVSSMNLSRKPIKKIKLKRPQEPKKPYPYYTEDVTFQNAKANITLSGTLTLPKKEGNYPAVILISGSGPNNRDEEVCGHKPFLVISDYLTRNGIAVLRYDKRGYGETIEDFQKATLVDFASDVESAISYLKTRKDINKNKIGLIGHSEGGVVASIVASESKDVKFIVLLAGPGIPTFKIMLLQQELIARASGVSETKIQKAKENNIKIFDIVLKSKDSQALKTDLTKCIKKMINSSNVKIPKGMTENEYITRKVNIFSAPGRNFSMKYNPITALEKVKCPVLAVNGEKDLQVPPKENMAAIKNALEKGGNKNITIKEYPNLNHLFQECKTGSPSEYAIIEETFSPMVLKEMSDWIKEQTKINQSNT
jgi:uncharacterized protein